MAGSTGLSESSPAGLRLPELLLASGNCSSTGNVVPLLLAVQAQDLPSNLTLLVMRQCSCTMALTAETENTENVELLQGVTISQR